MSFAAGLMMGVSASAMLRASGGTPLTTIYTMNAYAVMRRVGAHIHLLNAYVVARVI